MKVVVESPAGKEATVTLTEDGSVDTEGLPTELANTLQSIEAYKSVERASADIPQEGRLEDGERYTESSASEKAQRLEEFFVAVGWKVTDPSEE
jgi:hypothetical protein